jgi:hypothetical protein
MTARYLLRLDDACSSMEARKWQLIEDMLDQLGILPIVAVVPDNQDPDLHFSEPALDFWQRVRSWQAKGWTIGMHGYQHIMHPTTCQLVLPFYERSEFAGLTYAQQAEKIRRSWDLFATERVTPSVWVAPAHCFDWQTLRAVAEESPIRIVSDGIARNIYFEAGFHWIPQQLWQLIPKPSGLWTVCLHPNTITDKQLSLLRQALEGKYAGKVTSLQQIELTNRTKSFSDHCESFLFWQRHRAAKLVTRARAALSG